MKSVEIYRVEIYRFEFNTENWFAISSPNNVLLVIGNGTASVFSGDDLHHEKTVELTIGNKIQVGNFIIIPTWISKSGRSGAGKIIAPEFSYIVPTIRLNSPLSDRMVTSLDCDNKEKFLCYNSSSHDIFFFRRGKDDYFKKVFDTEILVEIVDEFGDSQRYELPCGVWKSDFGGVVRVVKADVKTEFVFPLLVPLGHDIWWCRTVKVHAPELEKSKSLIHKYQEICHKMKIPMDTLKPPYRCS